MKIVIVLIAIVVAAGTLWWSLPGGMLAGTAPEPEPVFCTADAFQCPDGTFVGRTGPDCQFVCPTAN
jgi:hypothetical protein